MNEYSVREIRRVNNRVGGVGRMGERRRKKKEKSEELSLYFQGLRQNP